MEWAILFVVFDLIALALLLSRSDRVPAETAAKHLRDGALVIDVRMPLEYAASHLPNAVNIPVTGIGELVPMRIRNRKQVILLYGQLGLRAEIARRMLTSLGYSNAYNLGSFGRASLITGGGKMRFNAFPVHAPSR